MEENSTGSLSERVAFAIADYEGTDPVNLTPPLYESIDPDALNALFRTHDEGTSNDNYKQLEFTHRTNRVRVDSNGVITVNPSDEEE